MLNCVNFVFILCKFFFPVLIYGNLHKQTFTQIFSYYAESVAIYES